MTVIPLLRLRPKLSDGGHERHLGYCAGAIAEVFALTMMTNKIPTWNDITSTVKTNQPTLQPTLDSHTTVPQ